jgi:hypothetical protein
MYSISQISRLRACDDGRAPDLSHNKARAVTLAEYFLLMSQPTFAIRFTGTPRISNTSLQNEDVT